MNEKLKSTAKKMIFRSRKVVPSGFREELYPLMTVLTGVKPHIYPRYNIFRQAHAMDYTEILVNYHIENYKRILIYGSNPDLTILVDMINLIAPASKIIGVVDGRIKEKSILEIPVIKLQEGLKTADAIILNVDKDVSDIRYKLLNMQFDGKIIDFFNVDNFISAFHHPELEKFRNIHKGERCFVLGNGPSLSVDDLNTLHDHNEICFASNGIYKLYDRTPWRPTYYTVSDDLVAKTTLEEIKKQSMPVFMSDLYNVMDIEKVERKDFYYVHMHPNAGYVNHPDFSKDIVNCTYDGCTVVYDLSLQIAAFMGFSEIYLLGVDNTAGMLDGDNHFAGYYSGDEKEKIMDMSAPKFKDFSAQLFYEQMNRAFESADRFSKKYGFRIYNATRGGRLDVLERVNFDTLFNE